MPIMEWQQKFSLGMEEFDKHHQRLFELFNLTYEDFVAGSPPERLGELLDELIDYATYHFSAEECWMKECDYPHFREHREMHVGFKARVAEMQEDFLNGRGNVPLDALTFLAGWLSHHILVADAGFKEVAAKPH